LIVNKEHLLMAFIIAVIFVEARYKKKI